ncbi:hypothetical protein LCGC14_2792180 [marine sediment metagenome]|uniref:Uncharacterized protein n=1 Tax=marine sediment metagenome TaxID=412755 RepID=A0A0F8YQB2_9ZZZZ
MKLILLLFIVCCQEWLPNKYDKGAVKYYDSLDSLQWVDVYWHVDNYGIRQAIFAGLEGSNRPLGKHPDEDSYQDVGIFYETALLYRPAKDLRDSLLSHSFAAKISSEIDSSNIAGHKKRYLVDDHKWRAERPILNATMAYPGGSSWRNRLIYGMVFMARENELIKRLKKCQHL